MEELCTVAQVFATAGVMNHKVMADFAQIAGARAAQLQPRHVSQLLTVFAAQGYSDPAFLTVVQEWVARTPPSLYMVRLCFKSCPRWFA